MFEMLIMRFKSSGVIQLLSSCWSSLASAKGGGGSRAATYLAREKVKFSEEGNDTRKMRPLVCHAPKVARLCI